MWPQVVAFSTLVRAAERAASGKRTSLAAARFLERAEFEVLALQRALEADEWRPGLGARFEISDPKPRTITAVPFRDQVVHHALIGVLQPHFERRMIHDSYACRSGKGTHAALRRAKAFVRARRYFLKLDVRRFFDSLRHGVVHDTLGRIVKDRRVLGLCARVLRGNEGQPDLGVGLPLGALTSQWFANLALGRLDHHVLERLRPGGYVRYMDDFALFADERAYLATAHAEIAEFLSERLELELKERATILAPTTEGLPFLGWLIFPGLNRVRPENLRRYRWRLRLRRWQYETGRCSEESYRRAVGSLYELLRHGDTRELRRAWVRADRFDP